MVFERRLAVVSRPARRMLSNSSLSRFGSLVDFINSVRNTYLSFSLPKGFSASLGMVARNASCTILSTNLCTSLHASSKSLSR